MPEWTPKQRAAIQARNRSILVSAAAGSGKTTVLIERIMADCRARLKWSQQVVDAQ